MNNTIIIHHKIWGIVYFQKLILFSIMTEFIIRYVFAYGRLQLYSTRPYSWCLHSFNQKLTFQLIICWNNHLEIINYYWVKILYDYRWTSIIRHLVRTKGDNQASLMLHVWLLTYQAHVPRFQPYNRKLLRLSFLMKVLQHPFLG